MTLAIRLSLIIFFGSFSSKAQNNSAAAAKFGGSGV